MAALPPGFLILDANVLIDYCATERSILTLISRHVGQIHVPVELLEEVKALDESECDRLGLHVFEPSWSNSQRPENVAPACRTTTTCACWWRSWAAGPA